MVVAHWILTCPAGAALLARTLTADYRPLETADGASGARAVVLLSGGSRTIRGAGGRLAIVSSPSALRALETARVYRLLGDPLVIVSGGVTDSDAKALSEAEAIRGAVIALGVPTDRVIIESESRNTREEAVILKRLLAERGIDRFVIVTSPIHMGRSLAAFAVEGMHPCAVGVAALSGSDERAIPADAERGVARNRERRGLRVVRPRLLPLAAWLGLATGSTFRRAASVRRQPRLLLWRAFYR